MGTHMTFSKAYSYIRRMENGEVFEGTIQVQKVASDSNVLLAGEDPNLKFGISCVASKCNFAGCWINLMDGDSRIGTMHITQDKTNNFEGIFTSITEEGNLLKGTIELHPL